MSPQNEPFDLPSQFRRMFSCRPPGPIGRQELEDPILRLKENVCTLLRDGRGLLGKIGPLLSSGPTVGVEQSASPVAYEGTAVFPFELFAADGNGRTITSPFGWRKNHYAGVDHPEKHSGIDLSCHKEGTDASNKPIGEHIRSLVTGTAKLKIGNGDDPLYYVELLQDNVLVWRYLHVSPSTKNEYFRKSNGQFYPGLERPVHYGDPIAIVGASGTGPLHLHLDYVGRDPPYEVYGANSKLYYKNPYSALPQNCNGKTVYVGRAPLPPQALGGKEIATWVDSTKVKVSASINAPDWDLKRVLLQVVQPPYSTVFELNVTAEQSTGNRLMHLGGHKWSCERMLSGLPNSDAFIIDLTAETFSGSKVKKVLVAANPKKSMNGIDSPGTPKNGTLPA